MRKRFADSIRDICAIRGLLIASPAGTLVCMAESSDLVLLTDTAIPASLLAPYPDDAGGVCAFVGTTRADPTPTGRVVALEYEAYRAMAERQLIDLARRARERWEIKRLVLVHRVGRVNVGEPSVLVVVACPHRAEAFDACRWLIDTLKSDVAIWKRDLLSDGSTRWVEPTADTPTPPSPTC